MINRVFCITNNNTIYEGAGQPEHNFYYTLRIDISSNDSADFYYDLIGKEGASFPGLTLQINSPLTAENLQWVSSCLFFPGYLRIDDMPVVLLTGPDPTLVRESASLLSEYLFSQGIRDPLLFQIHSDREQDRIFRQPDELIRRYTSSLQNIESASSPLFFFPSSPEDFHTARLSLEEAERRFREESPALYALLSRNRGQETEVIQLKQQIARITTELKNQQQYTESLRSSHATRELQDYYTNEYEILPLWYKRLGHVLKVLTGKRTVRSLYRDDVIKYKNPDKP